VSLKILAERLAENKNEILDVRWEFNEQRPFDYLRERYGYDPTSVAMN